MIIRILHTLALWAGCAVLLYGAFWYRTSTVVLTPFGHELAVWGGMLTWIVMAVYSVRIVWGR